MNCRADFSYVDLIFEKKGLTRHCFEVESGLILRVHMLKVENPEAREYANKQCQAECPHKHGDRNSAPKNINGHKVPPINSEIID